jgi:stage III sporulation protein AE
MKIRWIVLIALVCLMVFPVTALAQEETTEEQVSEDDVSDEIADEIEENIENALSTADLHELEEFYNEYAQTLQPITGGRDFKSFLVMLAEGGADFDMSDIFAMVIDAMLEGVNKSVPAILQIVVIGLLFGVISHFKPSFGETGVSKAAQTAQFVIVGTITIGVLTYAFSIGVSAIASMTAFTRELFPLMITLLTALGGITSASILSPATVFLTTGISIFFNDFILPLIIVLTVFTLVNSFSSTVKLSGFCSLIKSIIKWSIGICSTIFIGIISLQGLLGSTFDGLSIKTAKYAIDKFVPVIGGMVSGSVEVLISSSLLIKNAVGVAGILVIAGIVIAPVFAILAHYFLFKLSAAVLEPAAGEKMGKFMQGAADVVLMLFAAVLASAVMFFITIGVIIGAGNSNVMLR